MEYNNDIEGGGIKTYIGKTGKQYKKYIDKCGKMRWIFVDSNNYNKRPHRYNTGEDNEIPPKQKTENQIKYITYVKHLFDFFNTINDPNFNTQKDKLKKIAHSYSALKNINIDPINFFNDYSNKYEATTFKHYFDKIQLKTDQYVPSAKKNRHLGFYENENISINPDEEQQSEIEGNIQFINALKGHAGSNDGLYIDDFRQQISKYLKIPLQNIKNMVRSELVKIVLDKYPNLKKLF